MPDMDPIDAITLTPTRAAFRPGEPVGLALMGVGPSSCRLDPGDNRADTCYWPPTKELVYDQPGRYRVRLLDAQVDHEIAAGDVEITGPLGLSVEGPYPVVARNGWPGGTEAIGGTDNTLGMLADPRDPTGQRVYYYWAHGITDSLVSRSTGEVHEPFALGEFVHAPVNGNPYTAPHYLDAGPVHYDVASDLLLMLALSGRSAGRGVVYGTVELLWSRDLGLSWQSAGPVVTQPVSFEQVAADPDAYGSYPNMGTSLLYRPDGTPDGDWLLCYFGQCEGPLFRQGGDMNRHWNPCGVARANVRAIITAFQGGRPRPPWT